MQHCKAHRHVSFFWHMALRLVYFLNNTLHSLHGLPCNVESVAPWHKGFVMAGHRGGRARQGSGSGLDSSSRWHQHRAHLRWRVQGGH